MKRRDSDLTACVGHFNVKGDRAEICRQCPKLLRHLDIFKGSEPSKIYVSPYKCRYFNIKQKRIIKSKNKQQ